MCFRVVIEEVYFGKAKDVVGDLRSTLLSNLSFTHGLSFFLFFLEKKPPSTIPSQFALDSSRSLSRFTHLFKPGYATPFNTTAPKDQTSN